MTGSWLEFAALGKEVLCNGEHYADARSPEAARSIAKALNCIMAIALRLGLKGTVQ